MRTKIEIVENYEMVVNHIQPSERPTVAFNVLQLEVMIDIRDTLVEISDHLKEIDSAAQIYQELNPI